MTGQKFWLEFQEKHSLTASQMAQFVEYAQALIAYNREHNITAITTPERVVVRHFDDSLALGEAYDMQAITTLCDVGTGGGFPALPLKIKYPHLAIILIEVNHKKVLFLRELSAQLGLTNVVCDSRDWRTFLRAPVSASGFVGLTPASPVNNDTMSFRPVDLFVSRASLQPEELIRVYRETSPYKQVPLVYWAAQQWHPEPRVAPYVTREHLYTSGNTPRKLIFFGPKAGAV